MSRQSTTAANADTAPVLGVLVCHDGQEWLAAAIQSLRRLTVRPRHVLAVDTGSTDGTARLLAAARDVVDGVVTLPRNTGFGAAADAAVHEARARWGEPGTWLWLLHDDCAPEPDCLAELVSAAGRTPSAALLGPLSVDWDDPRLVVEAGVSIDASGRRQTGLDGVEIDHGQFDSDAEVLAVSSAGALIRTETWTALGGYDPALAVFGDDLDFGWRVNRAGHRVLCAPAARLRHAAAAASGARPIDAAAGSRRQVERAHGLRTYLANCSPAAFGTALPAAIVGGLLLALALLAVRGPGAARAELAVVHHLVSGRAGLRAARAARRDGTQCTVTGLLTTRSTRLRNGIHAATTWLVRRRVRGELAVGRVPRDATEPGRADLPATGGVPPITRAVAGLRRYRRMVAVAVPADAPMVFRDSPGAATAGSRAGSRPSPVRRDAVPQNDRNRIMMVDGGAGKIARQVLLSPLALLLLAMTVLSLVVNRARLGLDLAGGRLLPPEGLGDIWSSYLAGWHPVGGGSAAPAPTALAVLGVLGLPFGSPAVAVSLLLLLAMPLAALSAYLATGALPVSRQRRALAAAAYAVLPPGIAGIAQGRLDVVLVFVLLPLVLAGTAAVVKGASAARSVNWLSTAAATALGLAVISAFAPLLHLLVLAVVLVGFVVIPAPRTATVRRALGLFAVVLLPLGLLIPWPAVVVQRPAVLLHGVGAVVPEQAPGLLHLLVLDPGGAGAAPWVGVVVVLAAVLALALRPSRAMLPGLGLVVLGAVAAGVLTMTPVRPLAGGDPRPGFTGGALLFVGCGLLWIALTAGRTPAGSRPQEYPSPLGRLLPATPWVGVVALAVAAVVVGADGPLTAGPTPASPVLAPALADDLAREGTSVLVVPAKGEPVRLTRSRTARFGDDDIAPLRATGNRLDRVADALRAGQPGETPAAISDVAATGVEFVVLPTVAQGKRALDAAGRLARSAPPTADGRPVLRVVRPIPGAELLGPALAKQARTGAAPPIEKGVSGVLVSAKPPLVAVRAAPGAEGRLLVVSANAEPGWRASVGGNEVPVVRGWGHQVAVPVPGVSTEVRVERTDTARTMLLLAEGAVLLLVVATAVPMGRRREEDD